MSTVPQKTVAEIALEQPGSARVLQKHNIDLCGDGSATLGEACARSSADEAVVRDELVGAELDRAVKRVSGLPAPRDPRALSTAGLIAHIIAKHHEYLRQALPFLASLALKVAGAHGAKRPELVELADAVRELGDILVPHLDEEEHVIFPALMARGSDPEIIARDLATAHVDHVAVGQQLSKVRSLADGFATPEWGCTSYRVLMRDLGALEADVLAHVHLEEHVLAPRFASS